MSNRFIKYFDSIILGSIIELMKANKIVVSKIQACNVEQFESDERLNSSNADLKEALENSINRIERIENKAMGTLLGVSVAITVFGASFGIIKPNIAFSGNLGIVRIIVGLLLISAIVYLLTSGYLSLQAYRIGEIYRPTLMDHEPLVGDVYQSKILLYCMEQNYRVATLRSNRLSASFDFLRNGLFLILLFGIVIIIANIFSNPSSEPDDIRYLFVLF